MSEDLRRKWCEDLEDLIQCPVCFERPTGPVQMCTTGHHICSSCKGLLCRCSICKAPFSDVRNYLAEFLVKQLDEIKISLVNPYHPINKHKNFKKATIGTQTEPYTKTGSKGGNASKSKANATNTQQAICPCYFEACSIVTTRNKMLQHIEKCHKLDTYNGTVEYTKNSILCKYTWPVCYKVPMSITYALQIKKMGTFLLKIVVNELGLKASLMCIKNQTNSKKFGYTLLLENEATSFKFVDETQSGPLSFEEVGKYLQVPSTDMKRMTQKGNTVRINLHVWKEKTDSHRNAKQRNDLRKRTVDTSMGTTSPIYDDDTISEDNLILF